jgi:hypothetical protein
MPLASKEGAKSYAVKCALSVEAMQILRDEEGMSRYCNCDKANLALRETKTAKRKRGQAELNESKANHLQPDNEDVTMFDYSEFYIEEPDQPTGNDGETGNEPFDDNDDDEEVEELLPGMNAPGYTSRLPDVIPMDVSYNEGSTTFQRQVTKRQSFYVESTDGEIYMEESEDEIVVTGGRPAGRPRGFEQGEVIVIDDD